MGRISSYLLTINQFVVRTLVLSSQTHFVYMTKFVTLAFIGDVMLGRGVNEEIAQRSPESFWGNVLPILQGADAVIANLECAITQHTQKCSRTPKVFYFRAEPAKSERSHVVL